ncbi:type VI secretion system-associated FHA domain protein TagH [Photobacterium makurazakiensis]|uniref:type VI secretion system-associated FHA domain protein TagH n=1 Tax=Photobacterium makurazakiensis TaxID=2910234 RepID=UPI003D0CE1C1
MELTLVVVSYHRFTSELEIQKTFRFDGKSQQYVIGRSQQCDWCLPDPERVISGIHAYIDSRVDHFVITDISTNGVFINRSLDPIGKDKAVTLEDGDILCFGDYEIDVILKAKTTHSKKSVLNNQPIGDHVHEEALLVNDGMGFGISTAQFNNVHDSELLIDEKVKKNHVPPLFDGNVEDNFVSPMSTHQQDEESNSIGIPEDWSTSIGSDPIVRTKKKTIAIKNREDNHITDTQVEEAISKPMNAFIQGLGINSQMIPKENNEKWWYELGNSMQHLMVGVMDILHSRSEFKHNNRLNQTLFKRQENNPLKFSATLDDAIHNLFNQNSTSFLTPEYAIKEIFSDMKNHEKALLAGVDGAVSGTMKLLSPESISDKNSHDSFWAGIKLSRLKSNDWQSYEVIYNRLLQELEETESPFYYDDFYKSYELYLKGVK